MLRTIVKSKNLYSNTQEGVNTQILLRHYSKSQNIGFTTYFHKIHTGNGGSKTNKQCSQYLGITIAERVLSKIFKNVKVMPFGNQGYDIICGQGYKIDIKSAVRRKQHLWGFNIGRNQIADYFLCLAFDSREDLNPEHLWLIPGSNINYFTGITISELKLDKWSQYEITNKLNDVINCCNMIRGD